MEWTRHLLVFPVLLPLASGALLLLVDETSHTLKALVSLASTALLPTDLLDVPGSPLRPVRSWADRRLAGGPSAIVDFAELRGFWSTTDPDRMSRDEVAAFAAALARTGLGVMRLAG